MVDILTISILVVNIIIALGVFINRTHLSHILCCGCIESDCKNDEHLDDDIIEMNILNENKLKRETNENIKNYVDNIVNTNNLISDV
jgi:hypothetical protein